MTNYLNKYLDLGDGKRLAASEQSWRSEDFRQVFKEPPGGHYLEVFWTSSWRVNLAVLQGGFTFTSQWLLQGKEKQNEGFAQIN